MLATSADGSKLAAGAYNGQIYTSSTGITPNTSFVSGSATDPIELQYQGNGNFGVISLRAASQCSSYADHSMALL
jgi:hypothetical protein